MIFHFRKNPIYSFFSKKFTTAPQRFLQQRGDAEEKIQFCVVCGNIASSYVVVLW